LHTIGNNVSSAYIHVVGSALEILLLCVI